MDEGRWLHAELVPPPDGPQARARGEVSVIWSDGGVTIELTVRQLAVPQGVEVVLRSGDHEVTRLTIAGGSGSHGQTLDSADASGLKDGAEVTLHRAGTETPDATDVPLMRGVLSQEDGAA